MTTKTRTLPINPNTARGEVLALVATLDGATAPMLKDRLAPTYSALTVEQTIYALKREKVIGSVPGKNKGRVKTGQRGRPAHKLRVRPAGMKAAEALLKA